MSSSRSSASRSSRRGARPLPKPGTTSRPLDRNPVFQQLRIHLADAEAQVASARAKLVAHEAQETQLKTKARLVPQVAVEFAQLNRDYDVQKKTYETLLARRESATMGIGMQDTGGAQFRVIDPPRVAPQPVAPNRLALWASRSSCRSVRVWSRASWRARSHRRSSMGVRCATQPVVPVLGMVSMLPSPGLIAKRGGVDRCSSPAG